MTKVTETAEPGPIEPPIIARRGLMLVLSSPSGAGKSTIARALLSRDANLSMSVSMTTRTPRAGEIDGKDYIFVSGDTYQAMVAGDGFLEHAQVFDNHYGTPRAPVEAAMAEGRDVLFDVDWQGTQQLRQNARADLVSVFILPPSRAELERRLRSRAQDPEEVVRRRMAKAANEMSHWAEYDYVVVNACIDEAVAGVEAILVAERLRRDRRIGLAAFVAAVSAR
ncbi:MAG TPA: guanylate kinase [Rhodospirillales bacterium]|nr:guanylate kinase [Rhodospirillales bacterium]